MKKGRKMLTEKSGGQSNEIKAKNKQEALQRVRMVQHHLKHLTCQNDNQEAPTNTDKDIIMNVHAPQHFW